MMGARAAQRPTKECRHEPIVTFIFDTDKPIKMSRTPTINSNWLTSQGIRLPVYAIHVHLVVALDIILKMCLFYTVADIFIRINIIFILLNQGIKFLKRISWSSQCDVHAKDLWFAHNFTPIILGTRPSCTGGANNLSNSQTTEI